MHRGRFGGNARKRKAKLTDATFHAMIGRPGAAEQSVATMEPDGDGQLAVSVTDLQCVTLAHPALAQRRLAPTRVFCCQDYHFGYTTCRHCHSDQAIYVHQADLAQGYTFRCRICRHELTISAEH